MTQFFPLFSQLLKIFFSAVFVSRLKRVQDYSTVFWPAQKYFCLFFDGVTFDSVPEWSMTAQTFLVRHAQASFGQSNYDQLSDLGAVQARELGKHLHQAAIPFEAVYCGQLRRHGQTLEGILSSGIALPAPSLIPALNEYDADSLLQALGESTGVDTQNVASHFRQLRMALRAWMQGELTPTGMPTFVDFQEGLKDLLKQIQSQHSGRVLVVSSGGPISCLVASLLGADVDATIALNFRLRNASITELAYDVKRHHLISFNEVSHLRPHQNPGWVTFV